MKHNYMIGFDSSSSGDNCQALLIRLDQLGAFPVLPSLWILQSRSSAIGLRNELRVYIDANDRLLITEIGSWAYSHLINGDKFLKIAA